MNLQDGIEPVGEGAEDTTNRAYFGSTTNKYPFEPNPDLHYLLVHEHPSSWGMESQFGKWQRQGYDFVCYAAENKSSAWFSLPLTEYNRRVKESKRSRDETRERARRAAKTGDPNRSDVATWVERDEYTRGGNLINKPISFNG